MAEADAADIAAKNDILNQLLFRMIPEPVPSTISNPLAGMPANALTGNGKRRPTVDVLIDIGCRGDLFRTPDSEPYARVLQGGRERLLAIASAEFADYLSGEFYAVSGEGANRNAITDARATLAAMAKFDGAVESVHLRVAADDERILIDAGCDVPACYECTADGWKRLKYHPVNFRRSGKASALPRPTVGDFHQIAHYINVEPDDLVLVGGWLLAAFRPRGPYPLLVFNGEQGSAKSTSMRVLKMLTDPSEVPLRAPPKDERDLLIAAHSTRVVALDNISVVAADLSDALCRLSTGGGFSARKLYTDADETLISVQCPVMLNGIGDVVSRPDLAERCVHITAPRITERATEAKLLASFKRDAPRIFAALLDGVSLAMRDVGKMDIPNKPRMADFVEWAAAGVPALGFTSEQFIEAYRRNSATAVESGLDTSPVARAIQALLSTGGPWSGSANDLLSELARRAPAFERDSAHWPRSAKGLMNALTRLGPSLRHVGIEYAQTRSAKGRKVTLTRRADATCVTATGIDPSHPEQIPPPRITTAQAIFD